MSVEIGWNDNPYLFLDHEYRSVIFRLHREKCAESPIIGRVNFIVFALFDLTTDLLADPVHIICNVALATLRLFAIPFVPGKRLDSLKSAVKHTFYAIFGVLKVPCKLVRLPLVIANLFFVIIALPNRAKPANYLYKNEKDIGHEIQTNIYSALRNFSEQHSIAGRLFSIPVSLLDVSIDLLKSPVRLIDSICGAILATLTGHFRAMLNFTETALKEVWSVPVTVVMAPVKFAFQICAILYNPTGVSSFSSKDDFFSPYSSRRP